MGYYMNMMEADFHIKADKQAAALAALKSMEGDRFSWVDDSFRTAETLKAAASEWRYYLVDAKNGDIEGISFEGEKLGDDEAFFAVLGPFVTAGSYVTFQGEDGGIWRYYFTGKRMIEQYAEITFPESPIEDDRQLDLFPAV